MRGPGSLHGSDIFQAVAEVIGADATEKLCRALGGATIYVPASVDEDHLISRAIGMELAAQIAEHFHRTKLALPRGPSEDAAVRRAQVLEYRRTTDMKVQDIALATNCTEAAVYKILRKAGVSQTHDRRQMNLFG